jgi:NAD(P)-dependent dehydrogenase (short-subunit alcohol dehydrogenase family)
VQLLVLLGATENFCTSLLTGGTSIDYIICNAADQRIFPLHNIDGGEVQKIMQINFGSIAEIYATLARR